MIQENWEVEEECSLCDFYYSDKHLITKDDPVYSVACNNPDFGELVDFDRKDKWF